MKILNKLLNNLRLKVMSEKKLDELISSQVDNALTEFRNAHQDFFTKDYWESQQDLDKSYYLGIVDKIKNPTVKDIMNTAFSYFPIDNMSQEELFLIQSGVREKYNSDLLVQGAVDSFGDYVIGPGVSVTSPVFDITQELTKFRMRNNFSIREKNVVKDTFMDGEYFFLLFTDPKTGEVFVRKATPNTITEIETDPLDLESIFCFKREYSTVGLSPINKTDYVEAIGYQNFLKRGVNNSRSIYSGKFSKNVVCKMIKLSEEDKLRGRPPLRASLRFVKMYQNFILDRMILNHERAKVIWFKRITGRSDEVTNRTRRAPEGGTMLMETEGISYRTEKANLDSSEAKEDALNLLYYIGSGIRYPLHVLNQRTDQQVYASIRKADTPFSTMITGFQWYFAYEMDGVYRYQVEQLVKKGKLKETYEYPVYSEDSILSAVEYYIEGRINNKDVQELLNEVDNMLQKSMQKIKKPATEITITQDYPQIIWQDPKEMAEVLQIHGKLGIASLGTLSAKAGYNWGKEFARKLKERSVGLDPSDMAKTQNADSKEKPKKTVEKTKDSKTKTKE